MNTIETVLLMLGLSVGIFAALPGVGFQRVWYRVFGKGEISTLSTASLMLALLFAISIGIGALVGPIWVSIGGP